MHKLIIEDDEGKAVVVPLIRDEISIGRQEGNTIRLTERNVSRKHARLIRREGRYVIEDLTSYIGTKLNGTKIAGPVPLNDGDQVAIGDYRLAIKLERPTTSLGFPMPVPAPNGAAAAPPAAAPAREAAPPPVAVAPAPAPIPAPAPVPATLVATPAVVSPLAVSNPPEPIESAPTIPVRALAEQGVVPTSTTLETQTINLPPARLVVMTQPFTGQEFHLDRAALVIGRTQENDIVLNHKSISRHHAKVIRDGDRYVVVDLESANGVRVNGAEYERVELQSGDVLELGHVRLRFAAGDDPAVVDRDVFRLGTSNKRLIIGVGTAVVITAAVVIFLTGEDNRGADGHGAPVATAPGTSAVDSADALVSQAKEAYKQQKWPEALVLATRALSLSPGHTEADELRRAVEIEQQNAAKMDTLQRSMEARDYQAVVTGAPGISEGSVYKDRARLMEQDGRARLVAQHVSAAERLRSAGNCNDARKEAEAVLAIESENQTALDVMARCKAKPTVLNVAGAPSRPAPSPPGPATRTVAIGGPGPSSSASRPVSSGRPAAEPRPEAAPMATAPSGPDADELLRQAQQAYVMGEHRRAIESSQRALRLRPSMLQAYQIIAVCSCALKDTETATRAYEKLDDKNRGFVKSVCSRNGVSIE